jgi:hypothetical protein
VARSAAGAASADGASEEAGNTLGGDTVVVCAMAGEDTLSGAAKALPGANPVQAAAKLRYNAR